MAIEFTGQQQKILNARGHNILVSAAAGSGKTAVLVERIVRMISEGEHPMDIDRLLVVTFTRAAAAQMRERIAKAIAERIAKAPHDRHLQRQETLLHHAQITTIDSFCSFLLRNHFSEIELDPGFRQMDETQSRLLKKDVMKQFLEECYAQKDPDFLACVECFCPGKSDEELERLIEKLHSASEAQPFPEEWLEARKADYDVPDAESLLALPWYRELLMNVVQNLSELAQMHQAMHRLAAEPDGPYPFLDQNEKESDELFGHLERESERLRGLLAADGTPGEVAERTEKVRNKLQRLLGYSFDRLPTIRKIGESGINPEKKDKYSNLRKALKERMARLAENIGEEPEDVLAQMQMVKEPAKTLVDLTLGYRHRLWEVKKEKNQIDFSDLEHLALDILVKREDDGTICLRPAAQELASYYDEILIDEYQDSNDVQELLLSAVAGEKNCGFVCETGKLRERYARFMVGDVKQSIYRFRNARPEIFEEKFDTYAFDDAQTQRIDLDQNFRSRKEVLDAANGICGKLMRREIGGVEYDETVSLKPGARYPEAGCEDAGGDRAQERVMDPYQAELLLVDDGMPAEKEQAAEAAKTSESSSGAGEKQTKGQASGETEGEDTAEDEVAALSRAKKEALAVAQRIRSLMSQMKVTDEESGALRPLRYGDIVLLLRSTAGKQDAFREIFEKEGIPLYMEYKGGYFAAEEIRTVLELLRVLDNPRQDIPFYGVLRGFFGGFTQDEIGELRAIYPEDKEKLLCDCVATAAEGKFVNAALAEKCRKLIDWIGHYRGRMTLMPVHELIGELVRGSGYENYVRALPAGEKRAANIKSLLVKAVAFEQGGNAGLFRFLRYIDQMHAFDVDLGEANTLDEHADVVRMTTIHKSKGLEYPVCIVCGLGSGHVFSRDLSGSLLLDEDLGMGISYAQPAFHTRIGTLRRRAVAEKIARASLGEELRVLYVAMTRAKEKLILCGYAKDAGKLLTKADMQLASVQLPAEHLPVSMIREANGFLLLILESIEALKAEGTEPVRMERVSISDLALSEVENQMTQGILLKTLEQIETAGWETLPDPALAEALQRHLEYRYPYENLQGLFTKTTVSELKRTSMLEECEQKMPGEGAADLYPEITLAAADAEHAEGEEQSQNVQELLPVPRFAMESVKSQRLSGAARGTAIHRMCEKIDYASWRSPGKVTAAQFRNRVEELLADGTLPAEYGPVLTPSVFLPFLKTDVAKRMAAAAERGTLRREQPFVMGIPASQMDPAFPDEETVLIQGIMDAFFIEGTGDDRHSVLLDYKTDWVKTGDELRERYQKQMQIYAQALENMLRIPVTEKILYSFHLGRCFWV